MVLLISAKNLEHYPARGKYYVKVLLPEVILIISFILVTSFGFIISLFLTS